MIFFMSVMDHLLQETFEGSLATEILVFDCLLCVVYQHHYICCTSFCFEMKSCFI